MNKLFSILGLICFVLFSGCGKRYPNIRLVPYSLYLKFEDNNQIVADSILNKLILYGNGNYITDFELAKDPLFPNKELGILTTLSVGDLSSSENVKYYTLKYPDGNIDTLYIDYRMVSNEQGLKEPCLCKIPLKTFKVNGVVPPIDTLVNGGTTPVWLIQFK